MNEDSRIEEIRVIRDSCHHKIIFTNGCFDILHRGHIELLKACKYGLFDRSIVVVGLNSDKSFKRIKPNSVLINDECDRRFILEAIEFVDYVVPFDEDTPQSLIEQIKPDFLVKGGDYKESEIVGSSFVKSYGGEVVVLPFIGDYSTTKIRNRFKNE